MRYDPPITELPVPFRKIRKGTGSPVTVWAGSAETVVLRTRSLLFFLHAADARAVDAGSCVVIDEIVVHVQPAGRSCRQFVAVRGPVGSVLTEVGLGRVGRRKLTRVSE